MMIVVCRDSLAFLLLGFLLKFLLLAIKAAPIMNKMRTTPPQAPPIMAIMYFLKNDFFEVLVGLFPGGGLAPAVVFPLVPVVPDVPVLPVVPEVPVVLEVPVVPVVPLEVPIVPDVPVVLAEDPVVPEVPLVATVAEVPVVPVVPTD